MDSEDNVINIWELLMICAKRTRLILAITFTGAVIAIAYAMLAPHVYEASAIIAPRMDAESPQMGNLKSLGKMVGANFGNTSSGSDFMMVEYTLRSSTFLLEFEEKYDILATSDIDSTKLAAEDKIRALKNVIRVINNKESGAITVALQSRDPKKSFELIQRLLSFLNTTTTTRQQNENQKIINELKNEIVKASDPLVKSELSKLLAEEMKKILYSRVNENSIYRVVSPPFEPEKRIKPRRGLIVVLSTFMSFATALVLALIIEYLSNLQNDRDSGEYYRKFKEYLLHYLMLDKIKIGKR